MRPERNFDMIDSYWILAKMARICVPKNTVSPFFSLSLTDSFFLKYFQMRSVFLLWKNTGSCSAILLNIDTFKSIWNWWPCLHKFITPNGHLFLSLSLSISLDAVFFSLPSCSISILYPIYLLPSEFLPCNFPFVVVTMRPWRVGRISKDCKSHVWKSIGNLLARAKIQWGAE